MSCIITKNSCVVLPFFSIRSTLVCNSLCFCGAVTWIGLLQRAQRTRSFAHKRRTKCPHSLCTLCLSFWFKPGTQFRLHVNFNIWSILFLSWWNRVRYVARPCSQADRMNRFLVLSWILLVPKMELLLASNSTKNGKISPGNVHDNNFLPDKQPSMHGWFLQGNLAVSGSVYFLCMVLGACYC